MNQVDDRDEAEARLDVLSVQWGNKIREIGSITDLDDRAITSTRATFYEVLLIEYKNRVIALQGE